MTNVTLTFNDRDRLAGAHVGLALFTTASETFGLEPFTSDSLTEAERIIGLADQVNRASWDAKQRSAYKSVTARLIAGDLDPSQAVEQITEAEHLAAMQKGQHTPAARLIINIRQAATPHVKDQDEARVLDWLAPAFDQAAADAAAYADTVDSIIGPDPQRDPPGTRSIYHHWEPRQTQLKTNRRLARAWQDLDTALETVYQIASIVHEMRALGIIRKPLTDTRTTVWSQVWTTIPDGAFTSDTRPGRVREFYRCNRHQHQLGLPTAQELDANSSELPHEDNQDAKIATYRAMSNTGYQSVFP